MSKILNTYYNTHDESCDATDKQCTVKPCFKCLPIKYEGVARTSVENKNNNPDVIKYLLILSNGKLYQWDTNVNKWGLVVPVPVGEWYFYDIMTKQIYEINKNTAGAVRNVIDEFCINNYIFDSVSGWIYQLIKSGTTLIWVKTECSLGMGGGSGGGGGGTTVTTYPRVVTSTANNDRNGYGVYTSNTTSYVLGFNFPFPGTDVMGQITAVNVVSFMNLDASSYDIRLYDITHVDKIAEKKGMVNLGPPTSQNFISLGEILKQPIGPCVLEFQIRCKGTNPNRRANISSGQIILE